MSAESLANSEFALDQGSENPAVSPGLSGFCEFLFILERVEAKFIKSHIRVKLIKYSNPA